MSTEDSESAAVGSGKSDDEKQTPRTSEPPLVRPYADIPAHMVEAPAVLTGSVREVLDRTAAGNDRSGAGDGEARPRFAPLRRWLDAAAEQRHRHAVTVLVVGVAAAMVLFTGVVLHQVGAWPFGSADDGADAPVPDARLPLPPPAGGTDGSPSDRDGDGDGDGDEKKHPKPSGSGDGRKHEDEAGGGSDEAPSTSPAPSYPSYLAPGGPGGGGQPGSPGCEASWQVDSQWENFSATVRVTNSSGQRINGWQVSWTWPGDQKVVKYWNAEFQESGNTVTARNVDTNAEIATTGEASFGLEATGSGTPAPRLTCRVL
ncbi:cellulose binding domain-containing protein [Streptomyces winkii]|uniref:cellulose binding domain-containing protein n=1 Tax=Streptomyces winkii TaxID=3051178 RepID=UPI0028CFED4E|nr:cellulose binding domain-containing protein [Streptomyces sp. DSM 40971]